MRLDKSGGLQIGSQTKPGGNTSQYSILSLLGNSLNANASIITMCNRVNTSSTSINDNLGYIIFGDQQAGEYGWIRGAVDAAPASGDYPGRIEFATTPDGSSAPVERMRIENDGDFRFPRYDRIRFSNISSYYYNTNWTPEVDGMSASQSTLTKVNFTFGTPNGSTAFGWEERIYKVGVSSVNIFDEESSIKVNTDNIGVTPVAETSAITAGQCPDITVYVGYDVAKDEYRKKLKYYMNLFLFFHLMQGNYQQSLFLKIQIKLPS